MPSTQSSSALKCPTGRLKRLRNRESRNDVQMKDTTKRSIVRWTHLVFAIPILGYIYSPFEKLPDYAPATRFVFLPAMVLSGLWMWKGHVLRRLIWKRLA